MPTPASCRVRTAWTGGLLLALGLGLGLAPSRAWAQLGPTPDAINGQQRSLGARCPLIVKPSATAFQPLRIKPSEVAAKNKSGCLSAGDAIYGPDGCPLRLCGGEQGVIPLPQRDSTLPQGSPQLPAP